MVGKTDVVATSTHVSKPLLKLRLLEILRDGTFEELNTFVKSKFVPLNDPIVYEISTCILHYAVQVAGFKLVKDIITNWVDNSDLSQTTLGVKLNINTTDQDGNTPLHLAAIQSRINVIQYLLDRDDINECVENHDGLLAIDMCKNLNVAELMQDKRNIYTNKISGEAEKAFDERNFKLLDKVFSNPRNSNFLNINRLDSLNGNNSLLHIYAKNNDLEVCQWLLNHGANPLLKNDNKLTPIDIIQNEMKQHDKKEYTEIYNLFKKYLSEKDTIEAAKTTTKPPVYKGYLKKYAYVGKGYKLRYFVLSEDGNLSYYKDAASSANETPRGSLNLAACYLHMSSTEKLKFDVVGGSNHSAKWKLKGNQPTETNSWVIAIQSAIRYAKDKKKLASHPRHQSLHHKSSSVSTKNINDRKTNGNTDQNVNNNDGQQLRRKLTVAVSELRPSSSRTLLTNNLELNDNLTPSGKSYVNRLIGNRLHKSSSFSSYDSMRDPTKSLSPLANPKFMISTAGISYINTNSNTSTRSLVNSVYGGDSATTEYQDGFQYDSDSDVEDWEEEVANKYNRDDEYLKVEYGPYVEKLNIYQKSIGLEISSINDLLNSKDFLKAPNALETLKDSVQKLSTSISQMNNLTLKRDEKLISMLTKQRDMNNVWINTMRDLELELEEKSERLETLGKGRNTLKRTLRKKIEEGRSSSNVPSSVSMGKIANETGSSDTIEQIAKFISETRQEDDLSEDDEFYDAEELLDELEMQQDETINLSVQNAIIPEKIVTSINEKQKEDKVKEEVEKIKRETDKVEKAAFKRENASEVEELNDGGDEVLTMKPVTHESRTKAPPPPYQAPPSPPLEQVNLPTFQLPSNVENEKIQQVPPIEADHVVDGNEKKQKLYTKELIPKKPIGLTKLQKEKELLIWKEGTYLGYDEPVRSKLTLSNDDRPKVSLWTVLKSMIGKDMTRMTLPVVFNEPTSLLQRVAEDVECSELLDKASTFDDSTLRLLYVSVFTASCYASTVGRIAKPFNPLLGETFEYCRSDKNYRFFSEQVSHHPPISATWTESPKWDFFGESIVDTNFNGRQFSVKHLGMWHIKLRPDCNNQEELYTYKKPDNTVIGILVGNPQVDNHGEVKIVNHNNGEYCILNFKARGWRSSNAYEVKGEVYDKNKKKIWVLGGHWNDSIYGKKITNKSNDEIEISNKKGSKGSMDKGPNYDGEKFLIWKANKRYESPFNLTQFAISLNAPQTNLLPWLPPTDTRLRPDQRAMEDGEYDKAASEKHKVEEKQRATKRKRDAEKTKYEPRYFEHAVHPITKQPYWKFKGSYWSSRRDKKLANAGDIF